jgi:hypothetical protein
MVFLGSWRRTDPTKPWLWQPEGVETALLMSRQKQKQVRRYRRTCCSVRTVRSDYADRAAINTGTRLIRADVAAPTGAPVAAATITVRVAAVIAPQTQAQA